MAHNGFTQDRETRILDLFAGPGGWDEALKTLGRTDVLGVEMDEDCCATRCAAGHATISADVRTLDPSAFAPIEGLIASPPCQTFSSAGKQLGLTDPRGQLVYEVMRFAKALRPEWIACEQVKEVLPIWRMFASTLRSIGYTAWAGVLNAADYGVPQVRKRAFLVASRVSVARPPKVTHVQHGASDGLFDDLPPWITMAEALGWDGPPPDDLTAWAWRRPATTVVRSFCPDVIAAPGYRLAGDGPRQNTPGSLKVTPEQMCRLQCVDPAYPFHGSPTKVKSLIGAFLPPPMAAAVLRCVLESTTEEVERVAG